MKWSFTKLSTLEQCPRKFEMRYMLKLGKKQKGDALAIGTGIDDFLEHYSLNPKTTNLESCLAVYHNGCIKEGKLQHKDAPKQYEGMVKAYYIYQKPLVPWETQKKFTIDCHGVPLTGIIDIITARKEKPYAIVDNKTSKKPYGQIDADSVFAGKGLQLTIYYAASEELYGHYLPVVGFHVLLKDKTLWKSNAFVQNVTSKRFPKQAEELKRRVKQINDRIETCSEFECRPSRLCDYCEFKGYCK